MRALKIIANAFIMCIVLPVTIVAVLGFVFAPLQAAANVGGERIILEADDRLL